MQLNWQKSKKILKFYGQVCVREPYNIVEANNYGCHIVTVPPNIIKKTNKFNYNLKKYSLSTVKQFYIDAKKSNLTIK